MHPGGGGAMAEVVAVGFDTAERDATKTVDFENALLLLVVGLADSCLRRGWGGGGGRSENDVDVRFFACADALACGMESFALEVGVQG